MQKDTKELLTIFGGYLTAGVVVVGSIGLMAQCSTNVAHDENVSAYRVQCVKEGGRWVPSNGQGYGSYCAKPVAGK